MWAPIFWSLKQVKKFSVIYSNSGSTIWKSYQNSYSEFNIITKFNILYVGVYFD